MYTKDFSYLLRILQTSKQSGVLLVEASGHALSPWQGVVHLENGTVTSCLVRNKADGRVVLTNDEALRWLTSQERLDWQLEKEPQLPTPALQQPQPGEETQDEGRDARPPLSAALWQKQRASIPQRTRKGSDVPVTAFASREHRQVLALVDGRRTIEEIVSLLHKPPEAVLRALQELRAAGFIL